ncbi:MAG: branched-chain amino acid ABC transporter permease, partial [Candidatus Dormibacteraceae bacterium]
LSLLGPLALVALAVVTLLIPLAMTDATLTVYVFIGLYAVVVIGLSLLMGYAGQVSLGQGSYFAIGAYAAALLTMRAGVPPLLSLVAACAGTGLLAALVGLPLLRLRGHYLAFATLAFQLIVLSVIGEASGLTGGDTGLTGIPTLSAGPWQLAGRYRTFAFAYVAWVLVAGALLVSRNLVRSRPGRALRALATSEAGALASGVQVGRYKLQVFAFSAALAGLSGGVFAFFAGYLAPETFPILLSVEFLLMAAVGGMRSIFGSLVGTALIYLLLQVLQAIGTLPGMSVRVPVVLSYAVYAIVLIGILLLLPQGIVPSVQAALARLLASYRARRPGPDTAPEPSRRG